VAREILREMRRLQCIPTIPAEGVEACVWRVPCSALLSTYAFTKLFSPAYVHAALGLNYVHPSLPKRLPNALLPALGLVVLTPTHVVSMLRWLCAQAGEAGSSVTLKAADVARAIVLIHTLFERERKKAGDKIQT
jgi:hypothetical protein